MKKIITSFLGTMIGIYFLSVAVFALYFNWQYAKHHGFMKWVFFGEIAATAKSVVWPYYIFIAENLSPAQFMSEGKIAEYADNEYGYAFQFPSNWKMLKKPPKGEAGEVRVFIQSPKAITLIATIGKLGKSISKQAFVNNPNSSAFVDDMINYTIESFYKKTSRDMGATRMVVGEKRAVPSEIAVKFFISTLNFIKKEQGELPVMVTGIHYIPFDKEYVISFLITSLPNPKAMDENELIKSVLNSFHLVGEKPL